MVNLFMEETEDLLVLDTKEIQCNGLGCTGRTAQNEESFIAERLVQQSKSLYDPIKRNNLSVFNGPPSKVASKTKQQLSSARNDCLLFSRLCISCQTREGNLDEFFQHETKVVHHPYHKMARCAFLRKSRN